MHLSFSVHFFVLQSFVYFDCCFRFPESFGLPYFKSKINKLDLIRLSPLCLSLSSFFLCWGFLQATIAFPQHNSLKKEKNMLTLKMGLNFHFSLAQCFSGDIFYYFLFICSFVHLFILGKGPWYAKRERKDVTNDDEYAF